MNAIFIWAAYGISAVVLTGMVIWSVADARRQCQRLEALRETGTKRRRPAHGNAAETARDARPAGARVNK